MNRRGFLSSSSFAVLSAISACATQKNTNSTISGPTDLTPRSWTDEEEELLEILAEEADPFSRQVKSKGFTETGDLSWFSGGTEEQKNWYRASHIDEAAPSWADKTASADYAHLSSYDWNEIDTFTLDAETLSFLADRNAFILSDRMQSTLIGLRGCTLVNGEETDWALSHELKLASPDHVNFNCVMGVWNREDNRIKLFSGSTVPHATSMWQQVHRLSGANILPCGLYYYTVGPHSQNSRRSKQVGAFRLYGSYFENDNGTFSKGDEVVVLRTIDDMEFSPQSSAEIWHRTQPWDNIHSAIYAPDTPNGKKNGSQKFSSAGCQILKGDYLLDEARRFTTTPNGPWAEFRKAAGLKHPPEMKDGSTTATTDDGSEFQYMLLTGAEAALHATGGQQFRDNYRCVRFGSVSDDVKQVQKDLGLYQDGKFGPGTMISLLNAQISEVGVMETGVAIIGGDSGG